MGDHGSDRYDHVEATWRTEPPPPEVVTSALATICPDCRPNVFVDEHPDKDGVYVLTVAHDETCPWLTDRRKREHRD